MYSEYFFFQIVLGIVGTFKVHLEVSHIDSAAVFEVMFCAVYLWPGDECDDAIELCSEGRLV